MTKYYIEKIGHGIEGGYYDSARDVVLAFDQVVSDRLADGWYQIYHEGDGSLSFIVLTKKNEDGYASIVGYQIKNIKI